MSIYEEAGEYFNGAGKLYSSWIVGGFFVLATILLGSKEKTYSQHKINYIQNSVGDTTSADTAKVKKTLVDKF